MTELVERSGSEAADELPEGWALVSLGEACQINPGKPPKDLLPPDAPVAFIPMAAVDDVSGTIVAPSERPYAEVRGGYTAFREGDVIVAKITPCMENGKAAVARGLVNGLGFGSTEFHVLRSDGAVLPEYVFHYVRQQSFRQCAEAAMSGAVGQLRVPSGFLDETRIPLPPLAEQRRIVAQVEALLARGSVVRERLRRVPAILRSFRRAVLAAACSGRLTADWRDQHPEVEPAAALAEQLVAEHVLLSKGHGGKAAPPTKEAHDLDSAEFPETWAVTELQLLCEPGRPITYGILKPGPDVVDGVPYIRVADFPGDQLSPDTIRRTARAIAAQYRRSSLLSGDILLSIRGTVGRVCRVPASLDGANITQDTARIGVHREVSADYVAWYLRSPSAQGRLERALRGVAVRGVNLGDVRVLQVALPPPPEQHEIVRRVEALFALADAVERRAQAASARADRLTQAILAKAFRGELVPTEAELARREGRDYQPAATLLARVRADRSRMSIKRTGRARTGARQLRLV